MKFRLTFKTPDVLEQIEEIEAYRKNEDGGSIHAVAQKFIHYGEYITIEFDTETETAEVVPL